MRRVSAVALYHVPDVLPRRLRLSLSTVVFDGMLHINDNVLLADRFSATLIPSIVTTHRDGGIGHVDVQRWYRNFSGHHTTVIR